MKMKLNERTGFIVMGIVLALLVLCGLVLILFVTGR